MLNIISLLLCTFAFAQEGIMPGEPDPNSAPGRKDEEPHHQDTLLDDRKPCPKGERRFQRMNCEMPDKQKECTHYSPVLDCHKKAPHMQCKKPKVPTPVYRCE